ncbi:ABC transporter permease [Desulfonauticus submarinus]|nr:ABC transporter permease [Desulfonauticus submarinus]
MLTGPGLKDLALTIQDKEVLNALLRSILTSLSATLIAFVLGTPLAYLLARKEFKGKKIVQGIIDLPIMIPHPVIGIAILGLASRNTVLGQIFQSLGIQIMGTYTGIITVLTFVGLPFYINTARDGFESVSPRLEYVARSLGAGPWSAFFRITFPLAWRNIISGMIMCLARAISEFGAVIIVAYHPMTAPVLIYERFTAYGLKYSQPVAVWLIFISLVLFVSMRFLSPKTRES